MSRLMAVVTIGAVATWAALILGLILALTH